LDDLTVGTTLVPTHPMVDETICLHIRGIGGIALGIPYIPRDMVGLSL